MQRIDRRAARTRKALHEAMIARILQGGYDAMTIKDVLGDADVGRSTFYAHYAGKEDLLRGGFDRLRGDIKAASGGVAAGPRRLSNEPLAFSHAFFAHAEGYKHVYHALGSESARALALGHVRTVLSEALRREWPSRADDPTIPGELAQLFVLSGFIAVLTWWLERRPDLGASDVDALFRRLVLSARGAA